MISSPMHNPFLSWWHLFPVSSQKTSVVFSSNENRFFPPKSCWIVLGRWGPFLFSFNKRKLYYHIWGWPNSHLEVWQKYEGSWICKSLVIPICPSWSHFGVAPLERPLVPLRDLFSLSIKGHTHSIQDLLIYPFRDYRITLFISV